MDFYILKKKEELIAVPVSDGQCKKYLDAGYNYIDKVAACDKKRALKMLEEKQTKAAILPLALSAIAFVVFIFLAFELTR